MANEEQLAILRQGVEAWNHWREDNPEVAIDLVRANLKEANLSRANLLRADLKEAILIETNLSEADLSNADLLRANLSGANLSRANLKEAILLQTVLCSATLRGTDLRRVPFIGAKLSGIILSNSILIEATLSGSNLRNTDLSSADLSNADLSNADLSGANLSNATLIEANLNGLNLRAANLSDTNFSRTNLSNITAWGYDLSKAILIDANLSGFNFSGADLSGTNLSGTNLSGASLTGLDLSESDLNRSNLSNANLSNANLSKSDLKKVVLNGAKFSNTNLNEADLGGVDLSGAELNRIDFSRADLSGADFTKAILNGGKISNTNLSFVQATYTKFIQVEMTGACIHDWHINNATAFEGIKCDYIYRGFDEKKNEVTDRLPINSDHIFKLGEFEQWINIQADARRTIDLTFTDGIDWQAFFESLQGVRQQYPASEVSLQAIEKKGSAFVIRLETTPEADQGAIEAKQKELYETQLKLSEAQGQVIAYKNVIESMVIKMAEDSKVTQNFNAPVGSVAGTNEGEMKAVQHNYASELRQTPAESAKEIQDLLLQLQQTNPTDIQSLVEQRVKSDPTLRQRIQNALKEGGLETMKVIFPLTGIAIETVRGWVEAGGDA